MRCSGWRVRKQVYTEIGKHLSFPRGLILHLLYITDASLCISQAIFPDVFTEMTISPPASTNNRHFYNLQVVL